MAVLDRRVQPPVSEFSPAPRISEADETVPPKYLERGLLVALLLATAWNASQETPVRSMSSLWPQAAAVLGVAILLWPRLASTAAVKWIATIAALGLLAIPVPVWASASSLAALLTVALRSAPAEDAAFRTTLRTSLTVVVATAALLQLDRTLWAYHALNEAYARLSWRLGHSSDDGMRTGFTIAPIGQILCGISTCVASLWAPSPWPRRVAVLLLCGSIVVGAIATQFNAIAWLLVVVAAFAFPTTGAAPVAVAPRGRRIAGAVSLSGAMLACLFPTTPLGGGPAHPSIGMIEGGLKDLELPPAYAAASREEADFSALGIVLPEYGFRYARVPQAFGRDGLRGLDVLVCVNPTTPFSPEQLQTVWDFVKAGGSLLVLGDHTDIAGTRGPVNQLLRPTSIRLNYDSAIPVDSGMEWNNSIQTQDASMLGGRGNGQLGVCVGASLSIGSRAQPIAVGDYGFSDAGRPTYGESHLGNMRMDVGERFGGLVLAAEERLGRGRIQAWGDTTGFQNSSLTFTHDSVARILGGLARRSLWDFDRHATFAAALALSLLGIALLDGSPLLMAVCALALGTRLAFRAALESGSPRQETASAVLDMSALPSYPVPGQDGNVHRFNQVFPSQRMALTAQRDFDRSLSLRPKVFVIVAPNLPYRQDQARRLVDYVRSGGHLVVYAGFPARANLRALLRATDTDILPDVYGAAHNSRVVPPEWRSYVLGNVWTPGAAKGFGNPKALPKKPASVPVGAPDYDADMGFVESYPLVAPGAQVLASCWGKPLAIRREIGRGQFTLVGDSRMPTAKGMGQNSENINNTRFVAHSLF